MTSKEIDEGITEGRFPRTDSTFSKGEYVLWEIALQLALHNEHCLRLEARYMALTAPALKHQKEKGTGQTIGTKPTTVKFKTKAGSPVSMKAVKTFVKGQKARRR